jgi:hypothetical protein
MNYSGCTDVYFHPYIFHEIIWPICGFLKMRRTGKISQVLERSAEQLLAAAPDQDHVVVATTLYSVYRALESQ